MRRAPTPLATMPSKAQPLPSPTPSPPHLSRLAPCLVCALDQRFRYIMPRLACFSVSSCTMPPMPPSVLAGRVSLFYVLTTSKPIRLLAIRSALVVPGLGHALSHTLGHTPRHAVCPPSTVVSYRENRHRARAQRPPALHAPRKGPRRHLEGPTRPAKARA